MRLRVMNTGSIWRLWMNNPSLRNGCFHVGFLPPGELAGRRFADRHVPKLSRESETNAAQLQPSRSRLLLKPGLGRVIIQFDLDACDESGPSLEGRRRAENNTAHVNSGALERSAGIDATVVHGCKQRSSVEFLNQVRRELPFNIGPLARVKDRGRTRTRVY